MAAQAAHFRGETGQLARGEVNVQRGLQRLAAIIAVLWFVFWTVAYVVRPYTSASHPTSLPPLALFTKAALIAVALAGGLWAVAGLRRK
jgi:hypothetical protein